MSHGHALLSLSRVRQAVGVVSLMTDGEAVAFSEERLQRGGSDPRRLKFGYLHTDSFA